MVMVRLERVKKGKTYADWAIYDDLNGSTKESGARWVCMAVCIDEEERRRDMRG